MLKQKLDSNAVDVVITSIIRHMSEDFNALTQEAMDVTISQHDALGTVLNLASHNVLEDDEGNENLKEMKIDQENALDIVEEMYQQLSNKIRKIK